MISAVVTTILMGSFFLAAYLVARAMNHHALKPWRQSQGMHWTLRARLLYPARSTASLNLWLLPLDGAMLGYLLHLPAPAWALGLSCWPAALLAAYPTSREIFPAITLRSWITSKLVTLIFQFMSFGALILTIFTIPADFGAVTWLIAGLLFFWLLSLRLGAGIWLLRIFGAVKPPDERLAGIVTDAAKRMNLRPHHIWVYTSPIANAMALPMIRGVMFSTRLMEGLTDTQITSVAAHELAHLAEPPRIALLRLIRSMIFFPLIFIRPLAASGTNGPAFIIWLIFIGVMFVLISTRRMSRVMEIRADAIATMNQGEAATYAKALERIYEINQMPAVMRGSRQTHPNLYDRMIAAGVTPDFPKPDPPGFRTPTIRILLASFCILVVITLIQTHAISVNMQASIKMGPSNGWQGP